MEIDYAFPKHYGFIHEELDLIINYDIKYRMGKELEGDDNLNRIDLEVKSHDPTGEEISLFSVRYGNPLYESRRGCCSLLRQRDGNPRA